MSAAVCRWAGPGLLSLLLAACVAAGGDGGYGADYYEPYGVDYGGWGGDYWVGPVHGDRFHHDFRGYPGPHAYRGAPASRPMPSLPSRGQGGGGFHGGGAPGHR